MKGFLRHEACPNCGSKDNLGRYADGSAWCFGCHYRERRDATRWKPNTTADDVESDESPPKPDDCGTSFSPTAVEWLAQYYLDIPTAIQRGVVYSPSRDQIIYQLGNVWQARNLRYPTGEVGEGQGNKKRRFSKNFTSGNVNECTHIYGVDESSGSMAGGISAHAEALVLVEDPVSSIRVASVCDSMPLLGSHLAISRLNALRGLYKRLVVWLDSDKLKEARRMAQQARLIGMDVRVIWTEKDPKCYTKEEIYDFLHPESQAKEASSDAR